MQIAILSRNPRLYSTHRLAAAAPERGHEAQVIDASRSNHCLEVMTMAGKTRTHGKG
jgi:hypothetical protein